MLFSCLCDLDHLRGVNSVKTNRAYSHGVVIRTSQGQPL
ncbi:hypothetical protein PL8927_780178 [Planktothrix serta PCC 8927]|uniref:Uncharacterized protein n=1 Tax=Planktothrix serta PCC 8927 TaxID=671068 RepID=A0A7Z9BVY1_9CYAN|nr:hypothetical protein PL8927_780178 [Planktothrix serta PCC 8927]